LFLAHYGDFGPRNFFACDGNASLQAFSPACPYFDHEGRLESGMGLISNNILHTRERLVDSDDAGKKRLLFRARFYDRVNPEYPA
jgi:hypothetical protein